VYSRRAFAAPAFAQTQQPVAAIIAGFVMAVILPFVRQASELELLKGKIK
jgi:hypothetical protein